MVFTVFSSTSLQIHLRIFFFLRRNGIYIDMEKLCIIYRLTDSTFCKLKLLQISPNCGYNIGSSANRVRASSLHVTNVSLINSDILSCGILTSPVRPLFC